MRGRFEWLGVAGCLLVWAGVVSAQTVSVPTVSEVNRKLDSLARVLRVEITGTKPAEPEKPEVKDCEAPLRLISLYDISSTGLTYNYFSVGVKDLTAHVYDASGKKVHTQTVRGVTSDRIRVDFTLPSGNYQLEIENALCKAVSNRLPFQISHLGDREEPADPPKLGFTNKGVYSKEVGGLLYEWIPSPSVSVEIVEGRVKIIAPETKSTFDGRSTAKRFLLGDLYQNRVHDTDARALFGEGLKLPPGNYHFIILYTTAQNWEVFLGYKWHYLGNEGNADQRAAGAETLLISIYDGTNQHERVSWIPQYQLTGETLNLPENKMFGVTRYLYNADRTHLFKQFTHLQWTSGWMDSTPKEKLWKNIQALNSAGKIQDPDWVANNSPLNKGYGVMSEATEQYDRHYLPPTGYYKSEEIYKKLYERQVQHLGVKSPNETWLISDYFTAMYGGSISGGFFAEGASFAQRVRGLSDLAHARSERDKERWKLSEYFARYWHNYRGFMTQGYLKPLLDLAGSFELFSRIYQHEKAGLAIPDRRKVTYITPQQEGLGYDAISSRGTYYCMPMNGGDLIRADAFFHSHQTFVNEAFFSLLLGNGVIIWDSSNPISAEPENFAISEWGGYDPHKTKFRKNGRTDTYEESNANHPKRVSVGGIFPTRPLTSDQGAWVGAKLYESILGRVESVKWADYTINRKSVIAKRGSTGTSKANVNGVQNFGQDNIVHAHDKHDPIVLITEGKDGKALVYINPFAGLTEEQGVEIEGRFFKFVGNKLKVVKL